MKLNVLRFMVLSVYVAAFVSAMVLLTTRASAEPQTFPVGFERFHPDKVYNFQLNRWYTFGFIDHDRTIQIGRDIDSFDSWHTVWLANAERARSEGQLVEAAFSYRAAEFYLSHDDPDRAALHQTFVEVFDQAYAHVPFERHEVPFDGAALPVMRLAASGEPKGTVVMHGGFDSFAEEFATGMIYFSEQGYDVVLFEGPGQGAARRVHDLPFDPRWERPTTAVLDHFGLEDVTLLGVSMGGYLCLRAAAHEPRISRVIAWSIAYDYPRFPDPLSQAIARAFLTKHRDFTNRAAQKQIDKGGIQGWSLGNMMYITGKPTPVDAIDVTYSMDAEFLGSEQVTQDVLILTGRHDHFVPHKMHRRQVEALTHARSVTPRVFTRAEHADNHCQMGNIGLALGVMVDWLADPSL